MRSYRILVTGSREYEDYASVLQAIKDAITAMPVPGDALPSVTVVHGGYGGADTLADRAARALGLFVEAHPADWGRYGKRAGYIRNAAMVRLGADICLAFYVPGAENRGTSMCANLAATAGIPVTKVGRND